MKHTLLLCGALLVVGCSDSSGPDSNLLGDWALAKLEAYQVGHPTQSTAIPLDGLEVGLHIGADSQYVLSIRYPDGSTDRGFGTLSVKGDRLLLSADGADEEYQWSSSGGRMTWTAVASEPIDLDGDGTPEDAITSFTWRRK
jgi:hypothetical protein